MSGFNVYQTAHRTQSRPFSPRTHQRRQSSSKTSNPPSDNSRPVAAPSGTSAKTTTSTTTKEAPAKRPTRLRRQKLKDTSQVPTEEMKEILKHQLPSVPSTQHLHSHDVHVASFFSIHRPISVTASVPPKSTSDVFSSIFTLRNSRKSRPADVIYTISSAVNALESTSDRFSGPDPPAQQTQEVEDLRAAVTDASASNNEITNLDEQASPNIHINIQELAKNFRPFVPPPPPVPMDVSTSQAQTQAETRGPTELSPTTQKSYSTIVTILENTHPDGNKTYQAHTSPIRELPSRILPQTDILEEPAVPRQQPFLERMRVRRQKWEDSREQSRRTVWRALSVRRQRKLKMKKHKYKKLMRKTRNLRRRLDRL
ncbi:hypothetical protein MMC06_001448 [Schaereria dolodes]|nr:hypothetical protein [Schaereria dolodes]